MCLCWPIVNSETVEREVAVVMDFGKGRNQDGEFYVIEMKGDGYGERWWLWCGEVSEGAISEDGEEWPEQEKPDSEIVKRW